MANYYYDYYVKDGTKSNKCFHGHFSPWRANVDKTQERRTCVQCGLVERKDLQTGLVTKNY